MKRLVVGVMGAVVALGVTIEGLMWWRNVHPKTPEHGDLIEDELED